MKEFLDFVKNFIGLILLLWLLFTFVIGIQMAPNDDMSPRIKAGDITICFKLDKNASFQDLVILKKNGTEYIGRVVAHGGDKVEITYESTLVVNDNTIIEENIYSETPIYEGFVEYPVYLAEDEYFILCDNREGGEDSRYYGPVKKDEIIGTIVGTYRRGSE